MKKLLLSSVIAFGVISSFAHAQSVSGTVLSSPGGRFVYGQVSGLGRDQYMLDTKTGRLWQMVKTSDGGQMLNPIWYNGADNEAQYLEAPEAAQEVANYQAGSVKRQQQKSVIPESLQRPVPAPAPKN